MIGLDITHRQDGGKWAFLITLPEDIDPHGASFAGTGNGRSWSTYGEFDQPKVKAVSPEALLRKVAAHYGYAGPAEVVSESGATVSFTIA